MLEWRVVSGIEKFHQSKKDMQERFDAWFYQHWSYRCSKENMLSPNSPCQSVYALMCLPPAEAKELRPTLFAEKCCDCEKETELWIETNFSFCDEYGCGLLLCPECAQKLKTEIEELERRADNAVD